MVQSTDMASTPYMTLLPTTKEHVVLGCLLLFSLLQSTPLPLMPPPVAVSHVDTVAVNSGTPWGTTLLFSDVQSQSSPACRQFSGSFCNQSSRSADWVICEIALRQWSCGCCIGWGHWCLGLLLLFILSLSKPLLLYLCLWLQSPMQTLWLGVPEIVGLWFFFQVLGCSVSKLTYLQVIFRQLL
jgi:hypothetical protein